MRETALIALLLVFIIGILYVFGLGVISFLQVFQIAVENYSEF